MFKIYWEYMNIWDTLRGKYMIMVKYSGCKKDIILGKEPQNILKIMRMKSLNKIAIAFVAILVKGKHSFA